MSLDDARTVYPILVRMAMIIKPTGEGGLSVADLYRSYFLKLFEAQFPNEKERIAQLISRWRASHAVMIGGGPG